MSTNARALEFSLLELLGIARKGWRFLVAVTLGALLLSYGSSFLIRPQYKASGSILPRQAEAVRGMAAVLDTGHVRGGLRVIATTSKNSVNIERLLSQEMRLAIVDSLDLVAFYGLSNLAERDRARARERAISRLLGDSHFELSIRINVLIINAVTEDPEMSRRIVDAYLDELQSTNLAFIRAQARMRVRYLNDRLEELRAVVDRTQSRLARFEASRGLVDPERQLGTALGLVAGLRKRITELELRQSMSSQDLSPANPERQALLAELEVNRDLLQALLSAGASADSTHQVVAGYPLGDAPAVTTELRRLERELAVLQDVEAALRVEVERGLLEQSLDVSTYFLLDRPMAPSDPIWPQRKLIALASTVVVLCGSYLVLLLGESLRRLTGGDRLSLSRALAKL